MGIDKQNQNQDSIQIRPDALGNLAEDQQPVLVVGMHNSGTSILTEILHKSGIFFGVNMGHYESHFFSIFINDSLILGGDGNWAKLPLMREDQVLSYEKTVGSFIKKHWISDYLQWGYDGKSPWGIKDPRLCVLLPLYIKIFPGAKVVHIVRDPNDIAASLTGKDKAGVGLLADFDHWKKLTDAYNQRVLDHKDRCSAYYQIVYEDLCLDPKQYTRQLFDFLGIPYTQHTEKLLEKVTPARIGSYRRWQENRKHPWRARIKSFLGH
jgi:hypothetical protein